MVSDGGISKDLRQNYTVTDPYDVLLEANRKKKIAEEKRLEEQRKVNNNYLESMLRGATLSCNDFWSTKYSIEDINSLQFHLSCNPNTDSSVYAKVAALKAQQPVLMQKLKEFEIDPDKKDSLNLENSLHLQKGLDRSV